MTEVTYVHSGPVEAVGVASLIGTVLSENNVPLGDGVAGLMIILLGITRPDLADHIDLIGPFIKDISVAIAQWEPPFPIATPTTPSPEVPRGRES